jgi:SAM-dependent methyltransferase
MLRSNGLRRTTKTIARKVLGIDRRQTHELRSLVGGGDHGRLRVLQMDASRMSFEDGAFDFVYSFAVFQHLERPDRVAAEMHRVLRPGGVAYLDFILYTSRTGSHDLRLLGGGTADIPLWAHLRPAHAHDVQQSAYLNRLRLDEWRSLFAKEMPGSELVLSAPDRVWLEEEARRLQDSGELADYAIEDLVTTKVGVIWRKPPSSTEAR